jgi:hypothetical protein
MWETSPSGLIHNTFRAITEHFPPNTIAFVKHLRDSFRAEATQPKCPSGTALPASGPESKARSAAALSHRGRGLVLHVREVPCLVD